MGLLLEEQRHQILSEAKSEIIMQGSWAERSDDVIRELNSLAPGEKESGSKQKW